MIDPLAKCSDRPQHLVRNLLQCGVYFALGLYLSNFSFRKREFALQQPGHAVERT
jgi:hypothetical protein